MQECQEAAERNYPLIRQYDLIGRTTQYTVENMAKNSSGRLADVLVRNLNGEFDETGMELRPEFRKAKSSEDDEVTIHAIEIDD